MSRSFDYCPPTLDVSKIVSELFKEPSWIRLKIVNGSSELLRFIAKMEGLLNPENPDHMSLIWRSSVEGPDLKVGTCAYPHSSGWIAEHVGTKRNTAKQ